MGTSLHTLEARGHGAYAAAGVDIAAGERAVDLMRAAVQATYTPDVLGGVGAFGALHRAPDGGAVLVSSADGVGTKVKIAIALDRHDTIGRDLVHHCIDDILTLGARPLFFLDYLGVGTLVPETVAAIVEGLAAACRDHGVALIGGETAEMGALYAPGDYDLAGFIVGTVREDEIVDGRTVQAGDVVIGLPSDGLHTNGYTLVRQVLAADDLGAYVPELGCTLGDELLRPHRCYLSDVAPHLATGAIKGMAHITGGGLPGNVNRTLTDALDAEIDAASWEVPNLFRQLERAGGVDRAEMFRTFNMGVGMVVITDEEGARAVEASASSAHLGNWRLGRIVRGAGQVRITQERAS